jgi:hypothetical protein
VFIVRISPLLAFVLGSPLLVGCGAAPMKLKYVQYDAGDALQHGDYSGQTKFSLAKSILLVERSGPDGAAQMTAVPAEATGPHMHFGVQLDGTRPGMPALTVTKLDNTNLVQRLGGEQPTTGASVTGGGLTAVAASVDLPAKAAARLGLPLTLDTERLLDQAARGSTTRWGVVENSSRQVAFEVTFGEVPPDAIDTRRLDLAKASQLYFYSACRTATVTFLTMPLARQQFTVTVSDPHFVQTIAIGARSTITSHAGCGVDSQASVAPVPQAMHALNQAIATAKSLNRAWRTLPGLDRASAITQANASNKPPRKPAKAMRPAAPDAGLAQRTATAEAVTAAAAAAAVEQKRRDEALRNAEVQLPKQSVADQSFSF